MNTIIKRNGKEVPFDSLKIQQAIRKCFTSIGRQPDISPSVLTANVVNVLGSRTKTPTVEQVQDIVEMVLQAAGEYQAAKEYILYREKRHQERTARPVPDDVQRAFDTSSTFFPTALQQFQFYDKYSRYNYDLGRRETWIETVDRATDYLRELSGNALHDTTYRLIHDSIVNMKVMPSMRLLAMAGKATRRNNLTLYNCSYLPVDGIDAFVEALIISMSGCGVGFSVERNYVECFPRIRRQTSRKTNLFIVPDSAEGWADALLIGLDTWFDGGDVEFDYGLIRPAGAPLRTKGGRASGPQPLKDMLAFMRGRILSRQGSFLRPLDAHDMMCAVGNAAVSGGMRRTAMISLFDYDDPEMRTCKDGDLSRQPQRWNANNSAVWPDHGYTQQEFLAHFLDMVESGRGEPGIFSRTAMQQTIPARRKIAPFGVNPCGEIALRPHSLCNLSAVIARPDDTVDTLVQKVEIATIIGTIQSLATHFPGLRDIWRLNCEEERLLGVDITGQMDCPAVQDADVKALLKQCAIATNRNVAAKLHINPSAAITCCKPSGNTSQLVNCSSGIHARWSPYYIRNVRVSAHSPLFKVLKGAGVPMSPENGQTPENATTWVVHFPVKSPDQAITRQERTAIEQCNYWKENKLNWTEHNPSVTITYQPDEIIAIAQWVWDNRDIIGGMAFLPASDAEYDNMPYEEISQAEYEERIAAFPEIDFSKIYRYEEEDLTTAAQEIACTSGLCEI